MVRRHYKQKDLNPACTADGNDDTAHAHTRHIFLRLELFFVRQLWQELFTWSFYVRTARDKKVVLKRSTS